MRESVENHSRAELLEQPVPDHGRLESALARTRASVFGPEGYPSLEEKAGALLHSLDRNHGLVNGTKRLALAATIAYLGLDRYRLTPTTTRRPHS